MNIDMRALEAIQKDKGIAVDDLLRTIVQALLQAYTEYRGADEDTRARVDLDKNTGTVSVIVSELGEEGEVLSEFDDTPSNFARIGAQAVREAIMASMRQAKAGQAFDEYQEFEGKVVSGVVQRDQAANSRGMVVIQLGTEADSQDGILLPAEQIPGEKLEHGDRVKAFIVGVNRGTRNVQINLSRTHPELVRGLFELEIPEVADGGINMTPDNRIEVDEYGRSTSAEGVWALGDVSSPYMLKHVANAEMRAVRHNLLHPDNMQPMPHDHVPSAVFTHPQIATVGLTERQAREAGFDITVKVQNYGDVAYGWAMEDTEGICKLIADRTTGKLLGAHYLGEQAATLIQQMITVMAFDLDVREVATKQYWIHPALPEVTENALLGLEF